MGDYFAYITTPLYAIFIIGELLLSRFHNLSLYRGKDFATNVALGVLGLCMDFLMMGICFTVINAVADNYAIISIQNQVGRWVIIFLAQDFCFYWLHRVEHYCRFFWAVHANHHSSNLFNFSVALRSSVLQPLYRYFFFLPCGFLGFTGEEVMLMYAINQAYAFFVHTKVVGKLGWYEWLFVTPSHHRVHHGSNTEYLDKNMGQVLIIWDKLFGTFAEEKAEVRYGLTTPLETFFIPRVVLGEWPKIWKDFKKPVPLKNKLMYVFGPPGWSHDGSTLTSAQMRRMGVERKNILTPENHKDKQLLPIYDNTENRR